MGKSSSPGIYEGEVQMKCIEAQKLVKPYLEKELSDKQLEQFLDHVENCRECYDELEIYFFIYETLGGAALEESEAEEYDFKEKLKKDIKNSRRYLRVRKTYRLFRCAVIVLAELLLIGAVITGVELRGEKGSQGTTIYKWMYEREHSVKPTPKKIAEAERQQETQTELPGKAREDTRTETPKEKQEMTQGTVPEENMGK